MEDPSCSGVARRGNPTLPQMRDVFVRSPQAAAPNDPERLFTKQERVGRGNFGEVYKGLVFVCMSRDVHV